MLPSLVALPWWAATLYLGLSENAELAVITGVFGTLSSFIAAYFGYKTHQLTKASRRIDVTEDHGPVVGPPEPGLNEKLNGK